MLKDHKTSYEQVPEVGPTPDFLDDDLPTNLEYLDFGAAAGVRELEDEYNSDDDSACLLAPQLVENTSSTPQTTGETIKMFQKPIKVEEYYFERLTPEAIDGSSQSVTFVVSGQVLAHIVSDVKTRHSASLYTMAILLCSFMTATTGSRRGK